MMSNEKKKKLLSKLISLTLILATVGVLFVTALNVYFADKVLPGVFVNEVYLGGLTKDQAAQKISESIKDFDYTLTLTHEDLSQTIDLKDFGFEHSVSKTLYDAFSARRDTLFIWPRKDVVLPYSYEVSENFYETVVALFSHQFVSQARSASFVLASSNRALEIKPAKEGTRVDFDKAQKEIQTALRTKATAPTITIVLLPDLPEYKDADLDRVKDEAWAIISRPVLIQYPSSTAYLTLSQKLKLINQDLSFNEKAASLLAKELGARVSQYPRARILELSEDVTVVDFEIIRVGSSLDEETFVTQLKTALMGEVPQSPATVTVKFLNEDVALDKEALGINTLIGEGVSYYTGSIASRAHNLVLAAQRLNGIMVPPGGVFSFNDSVGSISAATGYQSAYVISGGRTILGDGGGVCQTSTTLFRAVLNSGLEVVMRHPHSYRVGYYEIGSPLGMDAAIFQPHLDFRFKNDTENYILIEYYNIASQSLLGFKIYGTSDGREVSISNSTVTNVRSAPAPLYQDAPHLAPGEVRQIDFAAGGATASFTRSVTKDAEVLHQDTFTSVYQPWRAVYLVGPEKVAPEPAPAPEEPAPNED